MRDGNKKKKNDTNYFFSNYAIGVSYIIINIFKFIRTLINLMAVISHKHVTVAVIKIDICTIINGNWNNDGVFFNDACTVIQQRVHVCAVSVLNCNDIIIVLFIRP